MDQYNEGDFAEHLNDHASQMFVQAGEPLWMTMERRRIEKEGGTVSVQLVADTKSARTVMASKHFITLTFLASSRPKFGVHWL